MLSDIRLGEVKSNGGSNRASNAFLCNKNKNYTFHHNSTQNKRGVAILISKTVDVIIIDEYRDQNENVLALHCNFGGSELILVSIYGPNTTDRTFYNSLTNYLNSKRGVEVVIGGDWNTTYSNLDPPNNIDCFNMVRTPNKQNGNLLREMCTNFDLVDPFRILHGDKIQYSYSPFGSVRSNRSRIDFFIVSSGLLCTVNQCSILECKLGKGFDNFPISLGIGNNVQSRKEKKLTSLNLEDTLLKNCVTLSAMQVYSAAICPNTHLEVLGHLRDSINRLTANIRECCVLRKEIALSNPSFELQSLLNRKYTEFEQIVDNLPNFETLNGFNMSCDNKTLFRALTERIFEKASEMQSKLNKFKNLRKKNLKERLNELSENTLDNCNEINTLEKELSDILEFEFRNFVRDNKRFEILNQEKPTQHFLNLAKNLSKSDSTSEICKDDGTAFENTEARSKYISNFFCGFVQEEGAARPYHRRFPRTDSASSHCKK
jgi:exonuclease III